MSTRTRSTIAECLLGTWFLVEFTRWIDGQLHGYPLGQHTAGQLTYAADGRVSALLMRRNRPWPADTEFLTTDDQTRGAAAHTFVGYGGSYRIEGDWAYHDVDISLYPEMVGTTLVRRIGWVGDDLVLETKTTVTPSGKRRHDQLVWSRAATGKKRTAAEGANGA